MDDEICTLEELRAIYRRPGGGAVQKEHGSINLGDRAFIAHAPFVVISTADADGRCDASPKGGPPGFVSVLDDGRVAIPDLSGNNRLDTMQNVLDNARVALLFLVPGLEETLRVNGRASLSTDIEVRTACAIGDAVPKVAIVVDPEEVYIHCGKALRRSGLWQQEQWPSLDDMPTPAEMLRDEVAPDMEIAAIQEALESDYAKTLWQAPQ